MKIALISPNANNLQEASRTLEAASHSVLLLTGGRERLRAVAEQEQPDLLIIEGLDCDLDELSHVEYVTTHFPKVAVMLLSANHTPDFLINAMRAGVREIVLSPAPAGALEAAVSRVASKLGGGHAKSSGKVLAFMPCKGGSGATFLATNLGYQLAETKSVLLIDLNLQFGDALSFVHDRAPATTVADVARDIHRLDASFLAASAVKVAQNYSILAAPEDPSQAVDVKPEHIDAILRLAVTQYDFVLLDMGRTIDPLSIKALDHVYRIFPVLQAGLPYLRNAKKLLEVFDSLGYPVEKYEMIVNRFDKRGEIGIDNIRRLLGATRIHTVPNSYKDVSISINHGTPLVEMASSSVVIRNLAEFTQILSPKREEVRGLLGRLFSRT